MICGRLGLAQGSVGGRIGARLSQPVLPTWTPSVKGAEWLDQGAMVVGARARLKQPGLPAAVWLVTEVEEGRSFTAETSSLGVRTVAEHVIEGPDEGPVRVHLRLRLAGPMAGVVRRVGGTRIRTFVEQEAAGLKEHSERAG